MKKQVVVAALVVSLIGVGVVGTTHTFAEGNQMNQDTLIQQLTDKFHLNKSDVQAVFDTHRADKFKEMQTKMDARLTQAVKDGKITEAQKTLILNKIKEMETTRSGELDAFKNMTPEQRKAKMQADKQALDAWAKQNNIPTEYLMHGMGRKMGRMMGK